MMTEPEFRRANDRRLQLLNKQFSGFTEAESRLRLDLDPEWEAEFERRIHANLTDSEREELAELTEVCTAWVDARYPVAAGLLEEAPPCP